MGSTWIAIITLLLIIGGLVAYIIVDATRQRRARASVRSWLSNWEIVFCFSVATLTSGLEITHRLFPNLLSEWVADIFPSATLIVLSVFAIAIYRDRIQRTDLIDEVRLATEGSGDVHIYTSWNEQEVENLIASARSKLVVVDTWFDEAVPLAHLISRARKHARRLKVDIYMADKAAGYGGQRLREIGEQRLQNINGGIFEGVKGDDEDAFKKAYAALFDAAIASLGIYFDDPRVKLTIYTHRLMPGLRLTVIDDFKYIFSWFPVGSVSVRNVCFCLQADSVSRRVLDAIEQLRTQLDEIRDSKNSKQYPIRKSDDQQKAQPTPTDTL
jgi:hypothetical protein